MDFTKENAKQEEWWMQYQGKMKKAKQDSKEIEKTLVGYSNAGPRSGLDFPMNNGEHDNAAGCAAAAVGTQQKGAKSEGPTGPADPKTSCKQKEPEGKLEKIASRITMKTHYGARYARLDLLRSINNLACHVTKCDTFCDRALHRLVCYIQSTLCYRQIGYVGDSSDKINCTFWSDASFAGCQTS